ncbi:MAG: type II toxin-antitoxin system VapC family toxin [Acidimicrobiales bacterium]
MSERVVCDASALVALLADDGPAGQWATAALRGADLLGPHLVLFEAANILRHHELSGSITADQAVQAHTDLLDLSIELWPYETVAGRAWRLRKNLSVYDAAYVALAELVATRLITLDRRLKRAPGIRCEVVTPGPRRSGRRRR